MPRKMKKADRDEDTQERLAKLRAKLPHDWEDLDAMDAKQLNSKIVECQVNLVETQREMAQDIDLQTAKNTLQQHAAPYRDAKKRLTTMAEYCTLRLETSGKA